MAVQALTLRVAPQAHVWRRQLAAALVHGLHDVVRRGRINRIVLGVPGGTQGRIVPGVDRWADGHRRGLPAHAHRADRRVSAKFTL